MSSLTRRLQIRALKRKGYRRTKFVLARDFDGTVRPMPVLKGGLILNSRDEFIGTKWPLPFGPASARG